MKKIGTIALILSASISLTSCDDASSLLGGAGGGGGLFGGLFGSQTPVKADIDYFDGQTLQGGTIQSEDFIGLIQNLLFFNSLDRDGGFIF